MLALRSLLVIDASATGALAQARATAADAVVVDLASPGTSVERAGVRGSVGSSVDAIAGTGRPVIVRASSVTSGELPADLEAAVRPGLAAIILAGTEVPQDARDADVLLRKFELRHEMTAGAVRLIPEIDSATGLQALPVILEAVDRHEAVMINPARMHRDLGLSYGSRDTHDHTMAIVAVAARAAELPWLIGAFDGDRGFIEATRAHEFGATGVAIESEASVRGVNSLFALDAAEVATARAVLDEWERLRAGGAESGVVSIGTDANPRTELVDRRSVRAARLVIARADAIAARERITN